MTGHHRHDHQPPEPSSASTLGPHIISRIKPESGLRKTKTKKIGSPWESVIIPIRTAALVAAHQATAAARAEPGPEPGRRFGLSPSFFHHNHPGRGRGIVARAGPLDVDDVRATGPDVVVVLRPVGGLVDYRRGRAGVNRPWLGFVVVPSAAHLDSQWYWSIDPNLFRVESEEYATMPSDHPAFGDKRPIDRRERGRDEGRDGLQVNRQVICGGRYGLSRGFGFKPGDRSTTKQDRTGKQTGGSEVG